jgi:transcriptional regulator with XRE-family HTH domain
LAEDWAAVGNAISKRLDELQMTQLELAAESGVSPATIRELQYNKLVRRRSPRTLESISLALKWPASYLGQVLAGEAAHAHRDEMSDVVLRELNAVHEELQSLRDRVSTLEQSLSDGSAKP